MEPNTFTGAALDRAGDGRRRDPEWLTAQERHPDARAVVAGSAGVWLRGDRLALTPLAAASPATSPLLLGLDDRGPVFAVDQDPPPPVGEQPPLVGAGGVRGEPPRPGGAVARPPGGDGVLRAGVREAAARLSQEDGGLLAYAAALLNWHRRHRFCATCGHETGLTEGGLTRLCPRCGSEHHPRTDPVVIMLVTDGDRVLLGRQPSWPPRRYSALAGFVEPGESLEEAVVREVAEEARVLVGRPAYVASQPWPFPASLMLGFFVPWENGDPEAAPGELQDARWFARAEVERAAHEDADDGWGAPGAAGAAAAATRERASLLLPPRLAIARRLVEIWLSK